MSGGLPAARSENHKMRLHKAPGWASLFLLAVLMAAPLDGHAQTSPKSLEEVLDIARARAPLILSAKARIEEARGRLAGASVRFQQNPVLETNGGPRFSNGATTADLDVSLSQDFELGGRRKARIAGAEAGVDRESATAQDAARRLLRDVAGAFLRALSAQERLQLHTETERIASEFLKIADRRFQAGDIPVLEVNLSRTSAARARSELRIAAADFAFALGELRVLLGMQPGETLAIRGPLKQEREYQVESLIAQASDRPDIRALLAELREADAEARLGQGFKRPDIGFAGTYQREEGANAYQGGFRITLPVFSRGQELIATGTARASRIRGEIEALRRAIHHEIRSVSDAYRSRVEAAIELEKGALPSLRENEVLARRSYEEGEIGLAELLLIRREILETRTAYVSTLLEMRLFGIELEFRAGVLK